MLSARSRRPRSRPAPARPPTAHGSLSPSRLAGVLVVLALVTVGTFTLIHLAPGGPTVMVNPDLSREDMLRIQKNLGLDQPLPVQYASVGEHAAPRRSRLQPELRRPGISLIGDRLPNTVALGLAAFAFSTAAGLGLGILSALRPGSRLD